MKKSESSGAVVRQIAVGDRDGLKEVASIVATRLVKLLKEAFAHLDSGSHFGKVVIQEYPKSSL